jgi:hypothetical protein
MEFDVKELHCEMRFGNEEEFKLIEGKSESITSTANERTLNK